MDLNVSSHNSVSSIDLPTTFNYSNHKDFKATYTRVLADPQVREVEIDFGATNYIDSAALGMLLMLRTCAEAAGKTVVLTNAQGSVKDILEIAHFETLFAVR